ncbi:MAG: endonuclease/exonuclease/phosphatase family protein [Archangiaceae bacterium]|nr:endonuclease/exonuclease/phosphatase family protein [Archangiaceae bacterium]
MRIISYNVRYFGHALKGLASTAKAKSRIAKAICGLDPQADIVCLQEVEHGSIRSGVAHRGAARGDTQLDAFMRHLDGAFHEAGRVQPYRAFYYPAHVYGLGRVKLYTTGLAILINARTLHVVGHNQNEPKSVTSYGQAPVKAIKQTRIVAHLHLETSRGKRLHVFNTHLSLPSPFRREFWKKGRRFGHGPNQLEEARTAAEYIASCCRHEPYLLCGDFNSGPTSPVYTYLTREVGMRGAQEVLGQLNPEAPEAFPTAGFLRMRMHLDHLFAGNGLEWMDLEGTCAFDDPKSPFFGLSDHVPLIANFTLG